MLAILESEPGPIIEGVLDDKYLPVLAAHIDPKIDQDDPPIIDPQCRPSSRYSYCERQLTTHSFLILQNLMFFSPSL